MNYPSKYLESAVNELSRFPGIGKKSALRLALFLLKHDSDVVKNIGNALISLKQEIQFCQKCHNLSDQPICGICSNPKRNTSLICVVSDLRDVLAIENTGLFSGVYHVLGGLIAPMEGVGPNQLQIDSLISRIEQDSIKEVILALSPTVEGDTTSYYIHQKIKQYPLTVSSIAKGVSIGGELEYADEITLGRSIVQRIPLL